MDLNIVDLSQSPSQRVREMYNESSTVCVSVGREFSHSRKTLFPFPYDIFDDGITVSFPVWFVVSMHSVVYLI